MAFPHPIAITVPTQGPPQGGTPGAPDNPDAAAALRNALAALKAFEASEQDDVDKQTAMKCIVALQGILAGRQKETEAALGTTPAHRAMARASGA